jgi:hypothetical protein
MFLSLKNLMFSVLSHLDKREMLGQGLDSVGCKDSHSLLMQLLPFVKGDRLNIK